MTITFGLGLQCVYNNKIIDLSHPLLKSTWCPSFSILPAGHIWSDGKIRFENDKLLEAGAIFGANFLAVTQAVILSQVNVEDYRSSPGIKVGKHANAFLLLTEEYDTEITLAIRQAFPVEADIEGRLWAYLLLNRSRVLQIAQAIYSREFWTRFQAIRLSGGKSFMTEPDYPEVSMEALQIIDVQNYAGPMLPTARSVFFARDEASLLDKNVIASMLETKLRNSDPNLDFVCRLPEVLSLANSLIAKARHEFDVQNKAENDHIGYYLKIRSELPPKSEKTTQVTNTLWKVLQDQVDKILQAQQHAYNCKEVDQKCLMGLRYLVL